MVQQPFDQLIGAPERGGEKHDERRLFLSCDYFRELFRRGLCKTLGHKKPVNKVTISPIPGDTHSDELGGHGGKKNIFFLLFLSDFGHLYGFLFLGGKPERI